MSLEDIPTMVLEIAEFARGSRGKDTGKEDFLGVVTMEVLDLDRDLMDANLIIRDVWEVVASRSQGDVTRFGSGFVVVIESRDRGVIWLGGTGLIDERDSWNRSSGVIERRGVAKSRTVVVGLTNERSYGVPVGGRLSRLYVCQKLRVARSVRERPSRPGGEPGIRVPGDEGIPLKSPGS